MKLLNSIPELAMLQGPLVLVPGTMDGVHLGHQALICRAREEANRLGGTAVVMTFDQHPSALLRPDKAPRLLTSTAQKLRLLEQLGVEVVLLLSFDQKLAATSAEEFVQQLAAHHLKAICVGEEWVFGQGGKGNIALLRRLGEELKFSVIGIEPVEIAGERVSSTRLRQLVAAGNLAEAAVGLARPYSITGVVIEGAGRGKKMGYPTANLFVEKAVPVQQSGERGNSTFCRIFSSAKGQYPTEEASHSGERVQKVQLPPFGVYVVRVHVKGKTFSGVVNIGIRPTVQNLTSHSTEAAKGFVATVLGASRIAHTLSSCAPSTPCPSSASANVKAGSATQNIMPTVEVHLFDFVGDLYGEEMELEWLSFLREEKKFLNIEELKAQIAVDVEMAKKIIQ